MADTSDRDRTAETTTNDRREAGDHRTVDLRGSKLLAGLASLFGAWIALSPFVYGDVADGISLAAAGWNNVIIGTAIFLVAGANFYRLSREDNVSRAAAGLVALLGLWLLVAPFITFTMGTGMFWSTVVSGLIVAAIGAYNAYKGSQAADQQTAVRTA